MAARQRKQRQQQVTGPQHVDQDQEPPSPVTAVSRTHSTSNLSLQPLGLLCTGTTLMVLGQFINMQVSAWSLPWLLSCIGENYVLVP
jgi:hypothetical protein